MSDFTPQQQQVLALAQARKRKAAAMRDTQRPENEGYIPEKAGIRDYARTGFDQGMQGATFGFSDEVSDRVGALIASQFTGLPYSDLLKEARETTKARLSEQMSEMPVTSIGANILGGVLTGGAGATTKAGAAVGNSLRTGTTAARIGKGAVAGAASGAAYGAGTADEGERLEGAGSGAILGGALGAAVPAVAAAGSGLKQAAIPKIDKAIKPLAQRARDLGIPLRADQTSPTKIRKTLQKVTQEVPGSGADNFEETQRRAFTKAVARTIGEEAEDLSPDTVNRFVERNSDTFEKLVGDRVISVDLNDVNKIAGLRKSVDKTLGITSRDAKILSKEIKAVSDQLSNGPLTGKKIANIRSDILKKSTAAGPGKQIFSDMLERIDDITKKSLTDEGKDQLAQARRQYRNFKTIEPLLEEATDGLINPVKLMNRVKSSKYIKASRSEVGDDDLVDLARIGKQFLPKAGGSDTFQKSALALGAVSTPGAVYGIATGDNAMDRIQKAALYGLAPIAAAKGYQKYNQSQRVVDLILAQVGKSNKVLPNTRGVLSGNLSEKLK